MAPLEAQTVWLILLLQHTDPQQGVPEDTIKMSECFLSPEGSSFAYFL